MSDQHSNPFVLPGMGQNADLSGNPLLASMEMMRQAWAGLTGPGGLASSLPMAPPMNLEDLDRRIAELRSVENWLRMNLSMLSSTIQGMEVQRSTISTLRAFVDSAANMDLGAVLESGAASPLEVVLGLKPAPAAKREPAKEPPAAGPKDGNKDANAAAGAAPQPDMTEQMGAAAQSASKAWWDLLQQQFNQIAAATAASMPGGSPAPDAGAAPKASPGGPQAAAKPAAKAAKASGQTAARKTARKPAAKPAAKNTGPADGKP
ncbi:PhaM family polyhydroxyalkanoate granule multifunctional regulatory protein [Achromobacter insuavis]|uniref:Transcriptional regulator AlgP domain-containing protein n=1 Tax=Achromobacter insuavis AXX-A TaxID=1003200 RepID=F7T092_9BURK|nr:PhaM family polyhydroxyalkanoate granule multifunctional regulatory protein [Achromobacter insuavis]EGP46181.1 transcriptional regulator AlgP domain-containing protein [Achromobacter insuavis AXX-A]